METYANVLLIALPSFMVLILIEILYGYRKKNLNYNLMDTISSLSAGATNIIKNLLTHSKFIPLLAMFISPPISRSDMKIITLGSEAQIAS